MSAMSAMSTFAVALLLLGEIVVASMEPRTSTAPPPPPPPSPPERSTFTGVWDAYPAALISVCPHIPRREIDFDQLNGRWFVMEKGGFWRPGSLCEMDFQVVQGQNLTLHVSLRSFEDGNLENQFNSTWVMSEDNVWRDYEESQMFMFAGYSTGRSLLLTCAVDAVGDTQDGYSLALTKEPAFIRSTVLAAARLPGNVELTDRNQCPET